MKAAALSIDFETENVMIDFFEGGDDPCLRAEGFVESVKQDWPTHNFYVLGDTEANEARTRRIRRSLGLAGG